MYACGYSYIGLIGSLVYACGYSYIGLIGSLVHRSKTLVTLKLTYIHTHGLQHNVIHVYKREYIIYI